MKRILTVFECGALGVHAAGPVHVRRFGPLFIARAVIAVLGTTNMPDEYIQKTSPFTARFMDNYAQGFGLTEEQALQDLKRDMKEFSDGIWAE